MLTDNIRGGLVMMVSMAFFTLNDTCMKLLAGEVPLFQIITLRGTLTTVATALIAWRMGAFRQMPGRRDLWLIVLRTVAEALTAYFFLTALFRMPLANVTAVLQSAPLVVTLAAAIVFREPVGWRRLVAILAGFVGVMLILRPGPEGFTLEALYILAAVGFITVRDLATRRLSREVPSILVTFATAFGVTLAFALAGLGTKWEALSVGEGALIMAAGIMVLIAYISSVAAIRLGEIAFVSPFRYTSLLWALALGWIVFGDWPRGATLVGAGIVMASGLYSLYREARVKGTVRPPAVRPGTTP